MNNFLESKKDSKLAQWTSRLGFRAKILISGIIWLVICLSSLTVFLYFHEERSLLKLDINRAYGIASSVSTQARTSLEAGDKQEINRLFQRTLKNKDLTYISIQFHDKVLSSSENDMITKVTEPESYQSGSINRVKFNGTPALQIEIPLIDSSSEQDDMMIGREMKTNKDKVLVILSLAPIYDHLKELAVFSIIAIVSFSVIGLILGLLPFRIITSPIDRIAKKAQEISSFNKSYQDPLILPSTYDSLTLILESLNSMREEINKNQMTISKLELHGQEHQDSRGNLEKLNNQLVEVIKLKNNLLLELSHEIKNPLNSLSALIQSLKRGAVPPDEYPDRFVRMDGLSKKINRLLKTIVDFAVNESTLIQLNKTDLKVTEVLSRMVLDIQPLLEEKHLKCTINIDDENQKVYADRTRLDQILLNLAYNAIKASPPAGEIVFQVEDGNETTFSVKDSGNGIPEAERPFLFTMHLPQIKKEGGIKGNGIGLFICKHLVELHGGKIWFERSSDQLLTTFKFMIPKPVLA